MLSVHNYICSLYHQPLRKSNNGLHLTTFTTLLTTWTTVSALNDWYIYFSTGSSHEKLIEPGEVDSNPPFVLLLLLILMLSPLIVTFVLEYQMGHITINSPFMSEPDACAPYGGGSHEGDRVNRNCSTVGCVYITEFKCNIIQFICGVTDLRLSHGGEY